MLNTKLDLYNAEWLDVVFDHRNKEYGAYELRRHYGQTMVKAMVIAFASVISLSLMYGTLVKKPAATDDRVVVIVIPPITPTVVPIKRIEEPPVARTQHTPTHAPTAQLPTRVTSEPVTTEPAKITDFAKADVGPTTAPGDGTTTTISDLPAGPVSIEPAKTDNTEHSAATVDVMPDPVGGAAAWAKFLNKNLRFPYQAQEAGKGGRVVMSFVIEKDGSLSGITVIGPAGYGMDEEASRVLKLAKPWKPGMQHGQAVRVRYTIPINFQITE
jgi:protein TonB